MGVLKFLLLFLTVQVKTLPCPTNQQACGSIGCYDPTIQGCINSSTVIQCINSCNGSCYSSSQYCYNATKICNIGELVCDVKAVNSYPYWYPPGLACYNPEYSACLNHSLCDLWSQCGDECITDYNTACANDNRTICYIFGQTRFHGYMRDFIGVCGPQKQCYDNRSTVCLNETTVCEGLRAQLCNGSCYNSDIQTCADGVIRCINSCNGSCYSSSQYCYNATKICDIGELVCDVKAVNSYPYWYPPGLACYNPEYSACLNHSLCDLWSQCGDECITDYNTACANDNRTICYIFGQTRFHGYMRDFVGVCGPQKQCYDNRSSVCLGENGIVCPIGSQLCFNVCYNPGLQTCISVNDSIYCLSNRSSTDCVSIYTVPSTSTVRTITSTVLRTSTTTYATTESTSQTTAFIITDCSCENPPKVFLSISAMIFILMSKFLT